jgi:hypothetical protein
MLACTATVGALPPTCPASRAIDSNVTRFLHALERDGEAVQTICAQRDGIRTTSKFFESRPYFGLVRQAHEGAKGPRLRRGLLPGGSQPGVLAMALDRLPTDAVAHGDAYVRQASRNVRRDVL